jgi:hypothetical protein
MATRRNPLARAPLVVAVESGHAADPYSGARIWAKAGVSTCVSVVVRTVKVMIGRRARKPRGGANSERAWAHVQNVAEPEAWAVEHRFADARPV